ncbi:hypothetical protein GQ55_5G294700 [Panicum hallii var. hallii]|uniref:Uncharacterized protein n=1 Tax=Panicum hallii var. hallii TaxID=1504633 RepID=A0A2T7DLF0_9POAL|nr:hypothetical protein GQ55_5G294700 [Panicum hallii var. hallii]
MAFPSQPEGIKTKGRRIELLVNRSLLGCPSALWAARFYRLGRRIPQELERFVASFIPAGLLRTLSAASSGSAGEPHAPRTWTKVARPCRRARSTRMRMQLHTGRGRHRQPQVVAVSCE